MATTYTKGAVGDTFVFAGNVTVEGTLTPNTVAELYTMPAADAAITIDAGTTDHTGASLIAVNLDVNSADCKVIDMDIDVGTALSSGDKVYGVYVDQLGLAGDDGASEMTGVLVNCTTNATGGINTGVQVTGILDTGVDVSAACTNGVLVSGINVDGIEVSGANTANGVLVSGINVDGIKVSGANTAAGVLVSGVNVNGINITGANTTAALNISGDQAIAILSTATESAVAGIQLATPTTKTVTTGLLMDGAGTVTTGINISPTAATTGISVGLTGKTYATGIAAGVTGGTLTSAIAFGGTVTAALTVSAAATMTNFIDFDAVAGCVVANALVPAAAPDAATVGADACIVIDINGTPYYIPLYNTLHA